MATLNLPMEDNLLQRAQSRAAAQGTTVNALLQGFLRNYADKSVACQQATRRILQLARESHVVSNRPRWTRESLYERAVCKSRLALPNFVKNALKMLRNEV